MGLEGKMVAEGYVDKYYIDSNVTSAPDNLHSFKGSAFLLYARNVIRYLDTISNKPLP